MKVYIGMSGGVDSSVSAALLAEQGYDVTGVYMKNWTSDLPGVRCPWADDLADAKRVAVQLGIDFEVFDFENEYKQRVVDYMIEEYRQGRTPNPDIMCNQEVKFKLFLNTALEAGADMIATGHYAIVSPWSHTTADAGGVVVSEQSGMLLCMAKDELKDQTYFLYRVTSDALVKTLFPIGNFTKSEVREKASERGLYTARKKDSQGICFVGNVGMRDFLGQYVPQDPGNIIDQGTGRVIGRHDGAIFYTLGQRHGLDVGGGLPYYVSEKNMETNEVYVTSDLNSRILWREFIDIKNVHWINDAPPEGEYQIRVRHRASLEKANIQYIDQDIVRVTPSDSIRAITPGQSLVIYDGRVCLGGGIVVQ